MKEIEDLVQNEEKYKEQTKESVITDYFSKWLGDFAIRNPDDYFIEMGIDDDDIIYNIQQPLDFLIKTLEIFGLPKGYIDGKGHHLNWEQNLAQAANARGKKKKAAPKKRGAAGGQLQRAREEQERKKRE